MPSRNNFCCRNCLNSLKTQGMTINACFGGLHTCQYSLDCITVSCSLRSVDIIDSRGTGHPANDKRLRSLGSAQLCLRPLISIFVQDTYRCSMDPVTFINRGGGEDKASEKTSIGDQLRFGLVGAAAQEVWEVRVNGNKSSGRLSLHLASTDVRPRVALVW